MVDGFKGLAEASAARQMWWTSTDRACDAVGDRDTTVAEEAGPAGEAAVAALEVGDGAGGRLLRGLRRPHLCHRARRRPHGTPPLHPPTLGF